MAYGKSGRAAAAAAIAARLEITAAAADMPGPASNDPPIAAICGNGISLALAKRFL
jgi:hypothetical protein